MRKSSIILACLLAGSPALAQDTSGSQTGSNAAPQNPGQAGETAQIADQIRTNLQRAGYRKIRLIPSSFVVQAEDRDNNQVMMVINPDSIAAIREVEKDNQNTGDRGSRREPGGGSNRTVR